MTSTIVYDCTGAPRPRWRGRIHTWAFFVAVPVAVALVVRAEGGPAVRLGIAAFGATMVAQFGVSASYHRLARSPGVQQVMRRLDHSMIFVFIAGTYTAVSMVSLSTPSHLALMAVVWTIAAAGVAAKVGGSTRWFRLSNVLYAVICGPAFIALPAFVQTVPTLPLVLLVVGGAWYIGGAVVFFRGLPDPAPAVFGFHEIWHVCTVFGTTAHAAMVAVLT